jgi:hypothetical protein
MILCLNRIFVLNKINSNEQNILLQMRDRTGFPDGDGEFDALN